MSMQHLQCVKNYNKYAYQLRALWHFEWVWKTVINMPKNWEIWVYIDIYAYHLRACGTLNRCEKLQ